jgi:peptidoglycan hydrolase-like protein with peptidoglycan-binding domain
MTEIGLLMTGVLSSTQPNLPHLPEQRHFEMENGVHNSQYNKLNNNLSQLTSDSQVTPPEFMVTEGRKRVRISALANKRSQILSQIRQKHLSSKSFRIADAQNIRRQEQLIARYPAYSRQTMPTLRFGSTGTSVRVMQRLLLSKGYGIKIDGIFGPLTETAIKAFQNQHNLLVDGVVGRNTWWKLSI